MIDFSDCTIHALCHPARFHKNQLAPRLKDKIEELAHNKAREADRHIQNKEYDKAIEILDELINSFEELEDAIKSEHSETHQWIFSEVTMTDYHGRVIRAAEEHNEDGCTIGALKSAKKDLEQFR